MRCTLRTGIALVLAVAGLESTAARAGEPPLRRFAIVHEIMHDAGAPLGRRDEFLDTSFHLVRPRQHLIVMLGSFTTGLEWGGYVRDRRGSAYGLAVRRRLGGFVSDTSLDMDTQQRWRNWVVGASARLFWPDSPEPGIGNLLLVPSALAQIYYQDESFASLLVTRDPRPRTGTTFRLANRAAIGRFFLDTAVAPRTDGIVHWAVGLGWRNFTAGYARERDFDFTRLDRRVFSFGFRWDFPVE